VGENRGGREQGEGIEHVGGEDVSEASDHTRPGLEVHDGAVGSLPVGLDIAVDIEGIYVMEEGAILQRSGQGPMMAKVAMDHERECTKFA